MPDTPQPQETRVDLARRLEVIAAEQDTTRISGTDRADTLRDAANALRASTEGAREARVDGLADLIERCRTSPYAPTLTVEEQGIIADLPTRPAPPTEGAGREWTLRRWNDPEADECSEWQVGEWPEYLRGDARNEQVRVREVAPDTPTEQGGAEARGEPERQDEIGQIIGLLSAGRSATGTAALREAVDCALDRLFEINNQLKENR